MKTPFLKALLVAGVLAPSSYAFSLYDTAPPIGLPESYAVRYSASLSMSYDDNINSAAHGKEDGVYMSASASASYADYESVNHLSYSASIGGRLYDKNAEGSGRSEFLDCSLSASLSHSFAGGSVYSSSLSLSFSVDPDIANGISTPLNQGECLNWSWGNSYSQSIDSRWSWTASCNYSGNIYTEKQYRVDDRQYASLSGSLSYRASSLTSYSLSASGQHDFRSHGEDSDNIFLNGSMSHSLSPVSSMSVSAGMQYKYIDDMGDVYPTLNFGYNRTLTSGLSVNTYLSYQNENVNNYRYGGTYRSTQTVRVGANFNYRFTHRVSFNFGGSLINGEYSDHSNGVVSDRSETTWDLSVGMNYRFTNQLSGHISYRHTDANKDAGCYERNTISSGLSYSF